jgi:serine protease Do
VLAHDRRLDLAALSVEARELSAIELGDSRRLRPGEWVFALGHPLGVRGGITGGVVIGLGDDWVEGPLAGREWLMVGLHLRPGHSGGPVFDGQGRMVGINTAMESPDVGLAVPVHVAKTFLQDSLKLERAA